jgi:hypothetical protein
MKSILKKGKIRVEKLEWRKTRVYAQKSRLKMPFKNSISAQLRTVPAVPLEPSVRILRPHPARVLPFFQRGAALTNQNKRVN